MSVLPLEARLRFWKKRRGYKIVRKAHGYRRSEREVLDLARRHGFQLRRTYYAGTDIEFMRSAVLGRIPFVMPLLRRLDRVLRVACNCVIFEFLLAAGAPELQRARAATGRCVALNWRTEGACPGRGRCRYS